MAELLDGPSCDFDVSVNVAKEIQTERKLVSC